MISDFSQRAVFLLSLLPHFITAPPEYFMNFFLFYFIFYFLSFKPLSLFSHQEYSATHDSCSSLSFNYQLFRLLGDVVTGNEKEKCCFSALTDKGVKSMIFHRRRRQEIVHLPMLVCLLAKYLCIDFNETLRK